MDKKLKGPQYLSAHGGFTNERPRWMPPKGLHTPQLDEILSESPKSQMKRTYASESQIRMPNPKPFKTPHITEEAARKIGQALHMLLAEPTSPKKR